MPKVILLNDGIEELLGVEEIDFYGAKCLLQREIDDEETTPQQPQKPQKPRKRKKASRNKARKKNKCLSDEGISTKLTQTSSPTPTPAPSPATTPAPKFDDSDLTFLNEMKSWGSFGIHSEILYALYMKEFFEPTKIQSLCLAPAIYNQVDILGAAETGSGKTLAFGIPIVNGILSLKKENSHQKSNDEDKSDVDEEDWEDGNVDMGCVKVQNIIEKKEKNKLYALVLTPTRELAVQVKDHLSEICKYTDIQVALVVGGLAHEKQERLLQRRPEIVVATPGRLWELINDRNVHFQDLGKIRYLAIDETDRMLEKGHFTELLQLLERINMNDSQKHKRQNFVFSATLTVVHDPPSYLKGKNKKRITPGKKLQDLINKIGITNPKIVDITSSQVTAENLIEYKIFCNFDEKDYYLYHFLRTHQGRAIVFCNSIGCVKRLANLLSILELKPLPLHANMEQKQRLRNLERFRLNEDSLLLATDVAARGLDIPNVDHVVHYQVPKTAETYVHRSGRTARVKNTGNALLLIEPLESKTYNKLIHTLGRDKEIEDFDVEADIMDHIKKIVHMARDVDQLSLAIKRETTKTSWYQKAIKDMDLVVDEEDLPKKVSKEADSKIRKDLNLKKKQLKELIQTQVIPRYFLRKFPDANIEKDVPLSDVRRDKLDIPGAFVLKKVPKME